MTVFTVHADPMHGFIVADASVGALSFAMVPVDYAWSFDTKEMALGMARAISSPDKVLCRMIDTPDRFEAVADKKYGCAW